MDIVAIFLGLYGTVLSTILAIREWKKEEKQIRIFLDHIYWAEKFQLTIVNVRHRPITIIEVGAEMYDKKKKFVSRLMGEQILDVTKPSPFPVTLGDGEYVNIPLSEQFPASGFAVEDEENITVRISVYDSEGKIYTKYKRRAHDTRWNSYYFNK